jgi:hypothetical protein
LDGELVYEYTAKLTGLTEYGASIEELLAGAAPPPSGLRIDIAFEGEVRGRLAGYIKGIDYLNVRADGRMDLDIKATITTPTGERIAVSARGVAIPQPGAPVSLLRENVKLTTAHPQYSWVNGLEFWATGQADMSKREVTICGYLPK